MAIKRVITGLRITWQGDSGALQPVVNIMATIADDKEGTVANASWTFGRSDLSAAQKAKLDAFLADIKGHVDGKLGGTRKIDFPV